MSTFIILLHHSAWDGHSSQPLGMHCDFSVTLVGKTIHVDIEVIDAPLD